MICTRSWSLLLNLVVLKHVNRLPRQSLCFNATVCSMAQDQNPQCSK